MPQNDNAHDFDKFALLSCNLTALKYLSFYKMVKIHVDEYIVDNLIVIRQSCMMICKWVNILHLF